MQSIARLKTHYQMKRPRKHQSGLVQAGKKGEAIAEKWMLANGFSYLVKLEPRIQFTGPNSARFVGKAPYDYACMDQFGRFSAVEVKSVANPELGIARSRLEPHQAKGLDKVNSCGGNAYVLAVFGDQCKLFKWPVHGWMHGAPLKLDSQF